MSDPAIIAFSAPVEIQARATAGKPRRFAVNAYRGGQLKVSGYRLPIVVDLSGLGFDKSITANLDHDQTKRVGHIDQPQNDGRTLSLSGVVSAASEAAKEFVESIKSGFPWQASIEAVPTERPEEIPAGESVTVNGRTFSGPILIARKSQLYGVAFLSRGADDSTSVALAAQRRKEMTQHPIHGDYEKTIQAGGPDGAHENDLDAIKAAWSGAEWHDREGGPYRRGHEAMIGAAAGRIDLDDFKKFLAEELERDKDLKAMRDDRPKGPAAHSAPREMDGEVIEAALCLSANLPEPEKHFGEQTLEAAHKHFRGFGLQQAIVAAAVQNGYQCRPGERINTGNLREILAHAMPPIHAALSTMSLPGILSNVANKELLSGWTDEDQAWKEISQVKSVGDFKEHTSYRLLDDLEYDELPKGGQIKHGALDEESYTRQAHTYAKMFALSRQDIVNDDLGAFDDLRVRLGRGSARKFNKVFWTAFLANSSFFTAARANYIDGATTTLDVDGEGLQEAVTAFRQLATTDGQRIGGRPELLLVPPELEFVARRLFQSTHVNTGGSATETTVPNANIHGGLYRPVVSDWLSDTSFTGASATAWYLLRKPSIGAAVVVSFLNGMQSPTVESSDADFNQLGIQFRGYHDFGVSLAEYLAGVKSKGAA